MNKLVNGKLVDLTPEDIRQREEDSIAKPSLDWLLEMQISDQSLPRWAEDLFDLITGAKKLNELSELKKKVADKKELRGKKP